MDNAGISPRFLVVEQAPGLPFTRGALWRLSTAHRRPAAVLVDELHTG
jgi:hypothetical protein